MCSENLEKLLSNCTCFQLVHIDVKVRQALADVLVVTSRAFHKKAAL